MISLEQQEVCVWVLSIVLCGLIACHGDDDKDESVANGAMSYAANCAGCHGDDGSGGPEAPDLTNGVIEEYSYEELEELLIEGTEYGMPGGLVPDDDELMELIDFLFQAWG